MSGDGDPMAEPEFFPAPAGFTVADLAARIGGRLTRGEPGYLVRGIAPLDEAGAGDVTFIDNPKYLAQLADTRAGAVICAPKFADRVPPGAATIEAPAPYRAFASAAGLLFPDALKPPGIVGGAGVSERAFVDPTARLEDGVVVEVGAVVGPRVEIGSGTIIAATAVIGANVRIGRNGHVGAGATIQHALLGDRVIVHPGVRIGQDGFGFAMGPQGHQKVPQVGRVVIQDDVEIGANTTIDRGANRDTVIGQGTKIDNQVQIGHNVVVGRHCVIVAHAGVSGSTVLEDYVVLAGKVGLSGHLRIGRGAQVAGGSNVADDIPAGERWVGTPARPIRQWMGELRALTALGRERRAASGGPNERRGLDEEPEA
jgi:UDP-3-O-[3-hydroxymyristoyl] glucosamine N-acyltransferase